MRSRTTPRIRAAHQGGLFHRLCRRLPAEPSGGRPEGLRPAAVLIPLLDRPDELMVLFTRRTGHLHRHAGEICFPGGTAERGDGGPLQTALRETREELGLAAELLQPLGYLPAYRSRSGFHITPVVALVSATPALTPDPCEVEEVFEVPLDWLLQPHRYRECRIEAGGRVHRYHEIRYGEYRIWGVTAGILRLLVGFLTKDLPISQ